jgi:protein SCO1/2
MTQSSTTMSRRRLLACCAALGVLPVWAKEAAAHGSFGPVQPATLAPAFALLDAQGTPTRLGALLQGRVTAVQLMFTGCSATCPIQGAMFSEVQQRLAREDDGLRLLSVSIDPLGDDPKALRDWLRKFGAAPPRWSAALPRVQDVDRLLDFLRGRANGTDRHTAQAFVFDRHARLIYRTEDMPNPAALVQLMQRVASRA